MPLALQKKAFMKGATIFREGDHALTAFLVESGRVAIQVNKNGKDITLNAMVPGQVFGELALIDDSPRSATAVAEEPTTLIVVTREDIHAKLEGLDPFLRAWIELLVERVRTLTKRVEG